MIPYVSYVWNKSQHGLKIATLDGPTPLKKGKKKEKKSTTTKQRK